LSERADIGKGWFGNKILILYVMGKWGREICPICKLFTVAKYIKKLSRSYNKNFAAGSCLYVGAAGILLTLVGLKRSNIKEKITIHIEKRGVWICVS
jgi:hypothetical protein